MKRRFFSWFAAYLQLITRRGGAHGQTGRSPPRIFASGRRAIARGAFVSAGAHEKRDALRNVAPGGPGLDGSQGGSSGRCDRCVCQTFVQWTTAHTKTPPTAAARSKSEIASPSRRMATSRTPRIRPAKNQWHLFMPRSYSTGLAREIRIPSCASTRIRMRA